MFSIAFIGCDEQNDLTPSEPDFVEVSIPDTYKSQTNGRTSSDDVDEIIMDVKITTTDGREVIGKINFIMPDDGTLSYFAMTENLLSETGLSADYWVEALNANSNSRIARTQGCFAECRKMEKGQGKGTCKAGCWLDIAVKVATVVAVVEAVL